MVHSGTMDGAYQQIVHTPTGAVLDEYAVLPRPGRSPKPRAQWPNWGLVFMPRLAELAAQRDLTVAELRIFLRLVAQAPIGECMRFRHADLARSLGLHRNTVGRALDGLIQRGVLVRDPDEAGCWWIDLELFWRGRAKDYLPQRRRLEAIT